MKLTIIGDFDENKPTHLATNSALAHAANALTIPLDVEWLDTELIDHSFDTVVLDSSGFLIAPGSPYKNMEAVLRVIRHTRLHNKPTLGTCGGFQHMVLEYARNVLNSKGGHAEYEPLGEDPVITPLSCSLKGSALQITITDKDSRVYKAYSVSTIREKYFCSYGLNPGYQQTLADTGFKMVATDETGEARIMELDGHPFFVAALFVPQVNSSMSEPNPLITAFLAAGKYRG